ncbi:MAG: hypothetical protein WKG32_04400 [Gemmatimonadaceae bacterium]
MMRSSWLPLVAVAFAAACSDRVATAPASANGPSYDVSLGSNPPPPELDGTIVGDFGVGASASAARASTTTGLSLKKDNGVGAAAIVTANHTFHIYPVEFNDNSATGIATKTWMHFPMNQVTPPNALAIGPISQGRIIYENGVTTATGRVFEFDAVNNGYWVIDLGQINGYQGPQFLPCTPVRPNCVQIAPAVVSQFYHIIGTAGNGQYIFEVFNSAPSPLKFVT